LIRKGEKAMSNLVINKKNDIFYKVSLSFKRIFNPNSLLKDLNSLESLRGKELIKFYEIYLTNKLIIKDLYASEEERWNSLIEINKALNNFSCEIRELDGETNRDNTLKLFFIQNVLYSYILSLIGSSELSNRLAPLDISNLSATNNFLDMVYNELKDYGDQFVGKNFLDRYKAVS